MHRVLHCLALILLPMVCMADGVGTADLLVLSSPGYPYVMMLGPAGRAVAGGPSAIGTNPALLSAGFTASGGRWNLSTTSVSLAGAISPGGSTSIGIGLVYLGRGSIPRRNTSGEQTGEYSFSTGIAAAGASFRLTDRLSAGLSAGVSWESIDGSSGTGLTTSLGLAYETGRRMTAGIAVTGLGSPPSWNGIHKDMPIAFAAGAEAFIGGGFNAFAGGELGLSTADRIGAGVGFCTQGFKVSSGYAYSPGQEERSGLFGGFSYTYESSGTFTLEAGFEQRDRLDWPILAGVSVRF